MLVLLMGRFMKYAAEMGSGATINIPSFIKIESGIQMLLGGGPSLSHTHTHTHTHTHRNTASRSYKLTFVSFFLLLSFKIRKVGLKILFQIKTFIKITSTDDRGTTVVRST
jgi:hypothetical protein